MLGLWFGAATLVRVWQDELATDAKAFIKSTPLLPASSPEALARSGQVGKELMKPHLCCF